MNNTLIVSISKYKKFRNYKFPEFRIQENDALFTEIL